MGANSADAYPNDVYVSFAEADRLWVEEHLLPRLAQHRLHVITDKDFLVGALTLTSVEQAVTTSRHTVVVLTPEWLSGQWSAFETALVQTLDPAAVRRRLLPVLLKPCPLPPMIAALQKADLTRGRQQERELARLVRSILDETPVAPPWQSPGQRGDIEHWLRWLRQHRQELRWAALLVLGGVIALSMLLKVGPFADRPGWQQIGNLRASDSFNLFRSGETLLVSTYTDAPGCTGVDTGLWRSTATTPEWSPIGAPIQFDRPGQGCVLAAIQAFAAVEARPEVIFAVTSHVGLLRSDDRGLNWDRVAAAGLPLRLRHIAIDPVLPSRLYVAADGAGFYRSLDEGRSWVQLDGVTTCSAPAGADQASLPPVHATGALMVDPQGIYLAVGDNLSPPLPASGLYVSQDGGDCWRRWDDAGERYGYISMAALAEASTELVVLTHDFNALGNRQDEQLWHLQGSQGRGRVLWESGALPHRVFVDPRVPGRWYVTTDFGRVVTGTIDRAGQWETLPRIVRCLIPPNCSTNLTSDFVPGPPLLLAGDQVYRLQTIAWYWRIWP